MFRETGGERLLGRSMRATGRLSVIRLAVLLLTIGGCVGDATDLAPTPTAESTRESLPESLEDANVLGTFFGEYDAETNRFSIVPVQAEGTHQPGSEELIPKRFDVQVIDKNGVADGTNTPGTSVEFQTESFSTPPGNGAYPTPNFTANIIIRSFYQRPLDNVYAEVFSLTPAAGGTITACTSSNDEDCTALSAIPSPLTGYLDPANLTKGIWEYGTILADGKVTTTWTWLGSSNFSFQVRVKASPARTTYSRGQSNNEGFVDACVLSGAIPFTLTDNGTTGANILPFPFTIYDETSSTLFTGAHQLRIAANGYINVGTGITGAATTNTTLPATAGARNGIFPFWDDLVPAPAGVCFAVQGTSPTRNAIVTWKNANVKLVPGSTVTFSAVLHEQTDVIDFLYDTPFSGNPDEPEDYDPMLLGGSATIGLQDNLRTTGSLRSFNGVVLPSDPSLYPHRIRWTPGD